MDRIWGVVGMVEKEVSEKSLGFRPVTLHQDIPEAVPLLPSVASTPQMTHRMQPLLSSP